MAKNSSNPTNQTKEEKLTEMRTAMKDPKAYTQNRKVTPMQWVLILVIIGLIVWLAYSW